MGMELNFTLVIQIFHFVFAYFIIRRWIVGPYTVALQEDEHVGDRLIDAIEDCKLLIAYKERTYEAARQECKKLYLQQAPVVAKEYLCGISEPDFSQKKLDSVETDPAVIEKIAEVIVKKALHDF